MRKKLKMIGTMFMAIIMLSVQGISSLATTSAKTYKISEIVGKYRTQGRTIIKNESLIMEWSASGIEFNAECSGDVSITVDANRLRDSENGGAYFSVLVDGVMQYGDKRIPQDNDVEHWKKNTTEYPFYINKKGKSTFVIAKNLEFGNHTFEIYNQTEAMHASFGISSITLDGAITDLPEDKELYIEFVGDSITAGLGNIAKGSSSAQVPLYQDATRGWAYLTAKTLNADWSIIAVSGIPACDGIGYYSASMRAVYPKTRYISDKTLEWDSTRKPDVVILGLGTNDIWTYKNKGKDLDYLQNGFEEILELIRTKNPNSKIVWIYGMMTSNADAVIKQAIQNKGGEKKGFYSLELPKDTSGGQGHPGLAIQKTYSEKVSSYISKVLKDECVTNHSYIEKISANYLKTPATCISKAIYYKSCSKCGKISTETFETGECDYSNHIGETYIKNEKQATCCIEGYTGDTYCSSCKHEINKGSVVAKTNNHKNTELRNVKAATENERGYTGDLWCLDSNQKIADGVETDKLTHSLQLTEAKAATATEEGNIRYYYCKNCNKYFLNIEGTEEIKYEETVIKKLPPEIIEGNKAKVNRGDKKILSFRSNAAFTDFIRVELDGGTLDENNYTKADGSIIINLKPEFVSTLSEGVHLLGIVSESGTATAEFYVNASQNVLLSPKTGDKTNMEFWSLTLLIAIAVMGVSTICYKKIR